MSGPSVRCLVDELGLSASAVQAALADAGDDGDDATPWYVLVLTGFGVWVGASLLTLVLALGGLLHLAGLRVALGLVSLGAAWALGRVGARVATTQSAWVAATAAHVLVLSGLDELMRAKHLGPLGVLLSTLTLLAVPGAVPRVAATLALWGWAAWWASTLGGKADVIVVGAAAAATALTLGERRLLALGTGLARPVAHGSSVALLATLAVHAKVTDGVLAVPLLSTLAGAALVVVAVGLGPRLLGGPRPSGAHGALLVLVVAAAAALAPAEPGVLASALVVALGVLQRQRVARALGLAALVGFALWAMYRLDVPLVHKALTALSLGALALVARAFVLPSSSSSMPAPTGEAASLPTSTSLPSSPSSRRARAWLLAGVVLAVGTPAAFSWQKEAVLRDGRRLLLPLLVRDPRSLLQGDYMVLQTTVADDARAQVEGRPRSGHLVVAVDAHDVARFVRFDDGAPLGAGEVRVRYRVRGEHWRRVVRVGADEFFFAEGRGGTFAAARYGEVRVADDGEVALVGLCDAATQRL